MDERMLLILDEGTTSTRAMLFSADGRMRGVAQKDITQYHPAPGFVEHDATEIWENTLICARAMVDKAGGAEQIAGIGITNQRETVVAWDKQSGMPLARAIVWQDRRTADYCATLREAGHEEAVQRETGLLLDPYFSATKMRWLLQNEPEVKAAAQRGTLAMGTIETWLMFKLSGGVFVTDASNASRTMLLTLNGQQFDQGLMDLFDIQGAALAETVDNMGDFGNSDTGIFGRPIPLKALVGDQQSATIGQGCLSPGDTKATYGTGAFILANHGTSIPRSGHRLLSTVLYQTGGQRTYALEGSVFVAGSLIQWLRDSLGILSHASESESLAKSAKGTDDVVIVPALAGLGAPHWRSDARGIISGLSFATGKGEIARAALEAMAYQTSDLASAFGADGATWTSLKIDGGMSANDWMAQDIANILCLPVERPQFVETTALGAAVLTANACGIYTDLSAASAQMRGDIDHFKPDMDEAERARRTSNWREALSAAL